MIYINKEKYLRKKQRNYQNKFNIPFFETSSLKNRNVKDVFYRVSIEAMKLHKQSADNEIPKTIRVGELRNKKKKKRC